MLTLFFKVPTMYSARNFSSTKDPQSFRGSQLFCGSRSASALLRWSHDINKVYINSLVTCVNRLYSEYVKNKFSKGCL